MLTAVVKDMTLLQS